MMMHANGMVEAGIEAFFTPEFNVSAANIVDVVVVDLTDEQTFAPEILTAEDVRRLLGIPRADRWCVTGDGTEK